MKVSSNQPKFTPFSITIDIESEGEARALYAIFNHPKNGRLIGTGNTHLVLDKIGDKYESNADTDDINNGIGGEYYSAYS